MRNHPTKAEALQQVQAMMIGLQRTRSIAVEDIAARIVELDEADPRVNHRKGASS